MTPDAPEDSASQSEQPCSPCRGTGEVVLNVGEETKTEPCPWCEGSGRFIPGHDAQERFQKGSEAQD